ncbi:hypothetical protein [Veillonella sp.]|uniref:hypothetical protein n=1 Tax=Veillonella sp. TaxID=1926307 RepID=UPI0025D33A30|nr:hypothetical protein [Veillonella sp.]
MNNGKYCPHLVVKGAEQLLGVNFIDGDRLVGLIRVTDDSELICRQYRYDGEGYGYINTQSDNR